MECGSLGMGFGEETEVIWGDKKRKEDVACRGRKCVGKRGYCGGGK